MNTFFILGIVQSVFVSILIWHSGKIVRLSQIILIIWLLSISLILLFYYVSFSEKIILFDLLLIFAALKYGHGPLLFIYTKSVLQDEFKPRVYQLFHFLPLLSIIAATFYYQYLTSNTIYILDGYVIFNFESPFLKWLIILANISNIAYLLLSIRTIYTQKMRRPDFYSNLESINLIWLKRFSIGLIVGYFFIFLIPPDVFGFYPLTDIQVAGINTMAYVSFAFYAGYINYRQQTDLMFHSITEKPVSTGYNKLVMTFSTTEQYKKSGLSDEKVAQLTETVLQYMEQRAPYLNPGINLHNLASDLKISTNHLSQILNGSLKKNFFTFINEYRVREFKNKVLMQQHQHFTLVGIALDCGFSSKSAFYAIFKKITGMTPADYIKEVEKTKEVA